MKDFVYPFYQETISNLQVDGMVLTKLLIKHPVYNLAPKFEYFCF